MPDRHPLRALRRLLATDTPTRGVVTARTGSRLTVATNAGITQAVAADDAITAGDAVSIRQEVGYIRVRVSGVYAE